MKSYAFTLCFRRGAPMMKCSAPGSCLIFDVKPSGSRSPSLSISAGPETLRSSAVITCAFLPIKGAWLADWSVQMEPGALGRLSSRPTPWAPATLGPFPENSSSCLDGTFSRPWFIGSPRLRAPLLWASGAGSPGSSLWGGTAGTAGPRGCGKCERRHLPSSALAWVPAVPHHGSGF